MNRRKILGMLGAAPLASSLAFPRLAKADGHLLNPNDSDDSTHIHRKLNYSSDNRVVYWYLRAIRYGLVDSAFTPFWDMQVGFISITEDDGDGFKSSTMSSIFYTDLETGKQIENFDNPYTGERLSVRQPGLGRSSRHYNKVGMENERPDRPGMNITQFGDVGPAWVVGDDVWVRGDTGFRGEPTTDEGSLIQINDWSTYHGSIAEVSDASVASANATQAFNDINTWPGWLNMGDRPGNYVSRGFGRKIMVHGWHAAGMERCNEGSIPQEFSDPRGYIEGA